MSASAWSTIASLATALGTLVLAVATFSAVRSSNLMAKIAQEQFLVQLRPVLTTSRREDPTLKVNFGDTKWVHIPGGGAVGEVGPGDGSMGPDTPVVYLAIALRNAGNGIAVLHGWRFFPDWHRDQEHAPLEEFERQNRDLYIPVGDVGFWQGAFRDTEHAWYDEARKVIEAREPWTVELLYGDHEGGQRVVSRFTMLPIQSLRTPGRTRTPVRTRTAPRSWAGWPRPVVTGTSTVPTRDDPCRLLTGNPQLDQAASDRLCSFTSGTVAPCPSQLGIDLGPKPQNCAT